MNTVRLFVIACAVMLFLGAQTRHASNDLQLEDAVSNRFLEIRADAKLPKLSRIKNRAEVQEITCTAASLDPMKFTGITVYQTSDPTIPSPELRHSALYAPLKEYVGKTRFAIAVWPARTKLSGLQKRYWVGIGLYQSPLWELLTYTMTDDIGHQNDWKKLVSPDCKGAR